MRKFGEGSISPLEAVARQLEYEEERLGEWRARISELRMKSKS